LLDHLAIDRVILFAASFGGMLASALSASIPTGSASSSY
jgi:pimeloyl-ACP methyl ester carboxylesterase